jgi:PPP family 3-phenylpropionic acid transporter
VRFPRLRRETAAVAALNAFSYGLASLYNNFAQIYIRGYHSTATTGVLLSIGPIVAMAAPFLWGLLADRARTRKSVYLVVTAGSAVGFALLGISRSFGAAAASLLVYMFFFSPLTGLNDLLSLEGCTKSGADYGKCRVFGTLFYGLLPVIISPLTSADINYIFVAFGLIAVLCAISVIPVPENAHTDTVPRHRGNDSGSSFGTETKPGESTLPGKSSSKRFFREMICDRRLIMLLLIFFSANFSFGCVLIYYPGYLTDTLGLPQSVWAAVVLATVAGEVPLFLFYDRIVGRLGLNMMIVLGILLGTLRMASYMVFKSTAAIILSSAVTGFGITLVTYSILIYVTQSYARNRRSTVMNFVYCLGMYAARAFAGAAAGVFVEAFGVPALMLAACIFSAASFAFYFVYRAAGKPSPRLAEDASGDR